MVCVCVVHVFIQYTWCVVCVCVCACVVVCVCVVHVFIQVYVVCVVCVCACVVVVCVCVCVHVFIQVYVVCVVCVCACVVVCVCRSICLSRYVFCMCGHRQDGLLRHVGVRACVHGNTYDDHMLTVCRHIALRLGQPDWGGCSLRTCTLMHVCNHGDS